MCGRRGVHAGIVAMGVVSVTALAVGAGVVLGRVCLAMRGPGPGPAAVARGGSRDGEVVVCMVGGRPGVMVE